MSARFTVGRSGAEFLFTLQVEGTFETLLTSERHATKASAVGGVEAVKEVALVDARYQRRTSLSHELYFVLRGLKNELLGTSPVFSSLNERNRGIVAMQEHAAFAVVFDET